MASRRALVTGAKGVVGRYLLKHLVETGGWDIVAVSQRKPDINLQQFMAHKGPVWDRIVKQYGLKPCKFEEIAARKFGGFVFSAEFTEVYQIEVDFEAKVKSEFDKMIYSVVAGGRSPRAA
jgi:nucleoside-diphosphate-sugar epimerase